LRRWAHEQQARQAAAAPVPASGAASSQKTSPSTRGPRWLMVGAGVLAVAALALTQGPWQARVQPPAAAEPVAAVAPVATGLADESPAVTVPAEAPAPAAIAAVAPPPVPADPPPALPGPAAATAAVVPPPSPAAPVRPATEPATRAGTKAAPAVVTGVVQLVVSPWAELEVDGADGGITPPVVRLTLSEGTHTLTLRNADYAPHSVQVQVAADKPVTVRHRFAP